jgi:chromosome segregation ATPase
MYTKDDLENLSPEDKKRKRNSLQMEIIMLESEVGKLTAERNNLDAELRKLRMDEERLRITMDEKKKRLEKVSQDIIGKEAEIKTMRKKLNLVY